MLVEFDYELAKLAINCKTGRVVTRNGKSVELVGTGPDDKDYPIVGRVEGFQGNDCWTENGKFLLGKDTVLDLFIEELI